MKPLTTKQLSDAMLKNKYLKIRYTDNFVAAINCGILPILLKKTKTNKETNIISYSPCDLNEYIYLKTPFFS
jgi:hypothetical protein